MVPIQEKQISPLSLHWKELYFFFDIFCDNRVQMGEMSRLGWLAGSIRDKLLDIFQSYTN
jgi:hypothetical protein